MKERPILMTGAMVRACLDGRKMQTRRVVRRQEELTFNPEGDSRDRLDANNWLWDYRDGWYESLGRESYDGINVRPRPCPYGDEGDRLWVRENFCRKMTDEGMVWKADGGQDHTCCWFQADGTEVLAMDDDGGLRFRANGQEASPWSPSIHMPRLSLIHI